MKTLKFWLIAISAALIAVMAIQIVSAQVLSRRDKKAFSKGMKFEKKGKFDSALAEYEKIAARTPDASDVLDRIAFIYMKNGDVKKAEDIAKKAIKGGGNCPVSYNIIGLMHERNNNLGYAEDYYLKSIDRDPEYAAPYNNLGNLHLKRGEPDLAQEYYTRAIEKDSKNPVFFNNLGYVQELLGNYEKAAEQYTAAEKLKDPSGQAALNLKRLSERTETSVSEADRRMAKDVCSAEFTEDFHLVEVKEEKGVGKTAVWESSSDANQRFIVHLLPEGNAFTDTIFAQMIFEHKDELIKMLENLSGTSKMTLTGQGYISSPVKPIMYIYADSSKGFIPLEGMFSMISQKSSNRHVIVIVMANKGFFKKKSAENFVKAVSSSMMK